MFFQNIWRQKSRIALLGACAAAIFIVTLFFFGLYPIATVNGRIITEKQFHAASAAVSRYYANVAAVYNQGNTDQKALSQPELEASALTGLIENELIAEKLQADLGKELPYILSERLSAVGNSPDLKKGAATMYGMSWNDFKEQILVSQAMKDILSENLFLKKENIDDWLTSAKQSASIRIFTGGYTWNGTAVVKK